MVLKLTHVKSIGKCALDANKQKDAPNGKAAICGLSSIKFYKFCELLQIKLFSKVFKGLTIENQTSRGYTSNSHFTL
jgi:hypothetical protein